MVASLLRLRLASLWNRVARPRRTAEAWGVGVAAILVVFALAGMIAFARAAAEATPELRGASFVVLGSAIVAGFWLLPFVFRIDDGMPLRAFAVFDLGAGRLAGALALTRLVSVPALLLLAFLAIEIAAWHNRGSAAIVVAAVAAVLALLICVLGSEIAAGIAGHQIGWRNLGGTVLLLVIAVGAPLAAALSRIDWLASGVTWLRRAALALEWTPFGVAWGAPESAAAGDVGTAWAKLLVAFGVVVVLALAWVLIVHHTISTVPAVRQEQRMARLGVFEALPPTAGGVIAARSIVYWMRDPRYSVPILILPIVPIVIAASFWFAGIPHAVIAWLCVPLVCLLLGWGVHNDIAADGTAFWLHVVTGVRGRADRWGRIVPLLVIGAVVAVGGGILTGELMREPQQILPLVALSSCALLVGLGVGSVASAVAPYPTIAPGNGPFAQPQALRGGEAAKQALSLLIALVLCAPTIGLVLDGLLRDPAAMLPAVVVGFVTGGVVLVGGIELGALAVSRRAPEILAFTQQN